MANRRPKYLNLFRIKLPLPGIVSFLHRISGALLFAIIPLFLMLFQMTLNSEESFEAVRQGLGNVLVKMLLIGVLWGFFHHLCSGLRFIAMDFHLGLELQATRRNSALVLAISLTLTALTGYWLW